MVAPHDSFYVVWCRTADGPIVVGGRQSMISYLRADRGLSLESADTLMDRVNARGTSDREMWGSWRTRRISVAVPLDGWYVIWRSDLSNYIDALILDDYDTILSLAIRVNQPHTITPTSRR